MQLLIQKTATRPGVLQFWQPPGCAGSADPQTELGIARISMLVNKSVDFRRVDPGVDSSFPSISCVSLGALFPQVGLAVMSPTSWDSLRRGNTLLDMHHFVKGLAQEATRKEC